MIYGEVETFESGLRKCQKVEKVKSTEIAQSFTSLHLTSSHFISHQKNLRMNSSLMNIKQMAE
jgi:hypothetical protein